MSEKSNIGWTDASWNPLRGCKKVSEGCRSCYAAVLAASKRMSGPGRPYEGLAYIDKAGKAQWTGKIRLVEHKLPEPLRWKGKKRVFVNSMSDLFHPQVPDEFILKVWAVMALSPHTFQVLTKRPHRMCRLLNKPDFPARLEKAIRSAMKEYGMTKDACPFPGGSAPRVLSNVWCGTSVENQEAADKRVIHLEGTPAVVRFLSCEPLLGPIDLAKDGGPLWDYMADGSRRKAAGIDWVIVGGESGSDYRPMDLDWARSLYEQCREAGVAFFFKQVSARRPGKGIDALGSVIQEYPVQTVAGSP